MPETAVEIAFVSPPFSWPGFGLNVSNWLGPPPIQSRMQAMPRLPQVLGRQADRVGPAHHAGRRAGRRRHPQEIAPMDDAIAIRPRVNVMFEFEVHIAVPQHSDFTTEDTEDTEAEYNANADERSNSH